MKKILILVLLISFAFGQGTIVTDTDSKCGKIIDGIFYEEECVEPTRERVITFGDILQYAEECYNDSTEKLGYYWYFGDDKSFIECDEMVALLRVPHQPECKKVWFHTTPTFPGFIEWLECEHGTFISSGDGMKICTKCGKGIIYDKKLFNKPLIIY